MTMSPRERAQIKSLHYGHNHEARNGHTLPADAIARRRAVPLVPWATGKCDRCGSTLVTDPLGHRCGRAFLKRATYSETVIP